ncbi:MAG: hypothetical protein IT172_12210 [Acidobacteria bacterium]|nr:hypothetical protein [Acidobacteriota bacterium]
MRNLSSLILLVPIGIAIGVGCVPTDRSRNNTNSSVTATNGEDAKGWTYSEDVDPMDDTKRTVASLKSDDTITFDFPYGKSEFSISVRKWKRSTDVFLTCSNCQFVAGFGDMTRYRVKFDNDAPFSVTANHSSSGDSKVVFLGSESKIISKLKTAKKMIVEAEFFKEGAMPITFSVGGFKF